MSEKELEINSNEIISKRKLNTITEIKHLCTFCKNLKVLNRTILVLETADVYYNTPLLVCKENLQPKVADITLEIKNCPCFDEDDIDFGDKMDEGLETHPFFARARTTK